MTRALLHVWVVAAILGVSATRSFAQPDAAPARGQQGLRQPLRNGPLGIPQNVAAAAARGERVRIIVGLDVPFAPEGLLRAAERVQQHADIAAAQNAIEAALARFPVDNIKRFHIIPGMAMEVDAAALRALAAVPGVAYIEEDEVSFPTLAESAAIIGAPAVWGSGFTGAGQTVAILDTGVDRTHAFFGGRVVSEACYSTTSAPFTAVCATGSTAVGSGAPCSPGTSGCDHGTHVAGIAAGSGPSFHGVARGANVIAIQVFSQLPPANCGTGATAPCVASLSSDQIAGLQRVFALRNTFNIAAANMSLGGGRFFTQAECDANNTSRKAAIDSLRSVGIATVIASGNNGFVDSLSAPACISTAVSVGSTTDGSFGASPVDAVSGFTNSASFLNLLAPGHFITSSVPGGGFGTFAGTSMAAPQVAGAWALLKSRFTSATVDQILTALTATGTGVFDPGNGLTKPRINVNAAMASLGASCTYALSPTSATVPAGAGTRTVNVITQAGCAWTAVSNAPFLSITGGASGVGPGTVTYAIAANTGAARSGSLTIAGVVFPVSQEAATRPALDLNGDGRLDLLWHHQTTGQIAGWLMNGLTLIDGTLLTPSSVSDTNWKLVGSGDLDADGHFDLVWQNIADGRTSAWLMNNLTMREGTLFSIPQVPDTNWRIRSVGDLNGDGRADLFWQHQGSGDIAVWLMNGVTVIDGTLLSPSSVSDTNWRIVGTADFDGNGSRDLVWHHQGDGNIAIWFMNGTSLMSGSLTTPAQVPDLNWKIRAVGDLNNDGRPDLLWQNIADGRTSVWVMNGLTMVAGTLLTPSEVPDTNWHIVGPR